MTLMNLVDDIKQLIPDSKYIELCNELQKNKITFDKKKKSVKKKELDELKCIIATNKIEITQLKVDKINLRKENLDLREKNLNLEKIVLDIDRNNSEQPIDLSIFDSDSDIEFDDDFEYS